MAKKDKITHKKVKGIELEYHTISYTTPVYEDLKLLLSCYLKTWHGDGAPKRAVTYEKVFERLLSKSGLGHVDPDVYAAFIEAKGKRTEYVNSVTRPTRKKSKKINFLFQMN